MDPELKALVKEMADFRVRTLLQFHDGRNYEVPMVLSEAEVANIESLCPNDQTMKLIGFRLPDRCCFIETSAIYANYVPYFTLNLA